MIDTVHCYFEELKVYGGQDVLIPFWERTWSAQGWKTRVLGKDDALKHPMHDSFMAHVSLFPTTNHRDYENTCYRRHLAMALTDGGLMTDYDVLNVRFRPDQMPELRDRVESLDSDVVPCATFGTRIAWENWVKYLSMHTDRTNAAYVSDMTIFRLLTPMTYGQCRGIFKPGWENYPLIHFANYHCMRIRPGVPRKELMTTFLNTGRLEGSVYNET